MITMYHIVVNQDNLKKKKNAKKLSCVKEAFEKAGKEFTVHKTNRKGQAREITEEVTAGSGNVIVVMGGDGTLHDVLNGFVNFEDNALGLIPLGTGNDFAASARVPLKTKKAVDMLINGEPENIDFIQLESGLRSLNAIGMGIDVDVLKRAYAGKNKKKSKYLHNLIVSLAKFESYHCTVKYNGKEEERFGLISAVGNGRQFGGGIKLFPEADIADGYMNLFITDYISKFATIGAFIKLMTGRVNKIKQITAVKTKEVEFIPAMDDYTVQADGELYDNMPFKAVVAEGKLKFYTGRRHK